MLLAAFVTYAWFLATATQQGADWFDTTEPLFTESDPSAATEYELVAPAPAAPPKASDTTRCLLSVNAKPKGVVPAAACEVGDAATPFVTT